MHMIYIDIYFHYQMHIFKKNYKKNTNWINNIK